METQHNSKSAEDKHTANQRVLVLDTTLRDGEQSPGFSMDRRGKLRMAHMLESLGVDVIEAGFPSASPSEFEAVRTIAEELQTTTVCALARCIENDISVAAQALERASKPRLHLFIASSPVHRRHKLGMSRKQVLDSAVSAIQRAAHFGYEIEFSAEDAIRTEPDFLVELFGAAIKAGASVLNAPDTVGYATPTEISERFRYLLDNVRGIDGAILSTHCHNDLGLAVANSLAAVCAGARQVECTVNGIGERAGNAALEEFVMALRVRSSHYALDTAIQTTKLYSASRLLSQITGQAVQRNKAIVGENAFAHEAGIHQHGMLRNSDTYEIMRPQDVGVARTTLVLGKHSGRAALRKRLETLGQTVDDKTLALLFEKFKVIADRQNEVSDDDLRALVGEQNLDSANSPQTLFEKIWNTHTVQSETNHTPAILYVDLHLIHEVTSPQAFAELQQRNLKVRRPDLTLATLDHSTPTLPPDASGKRRYTSHSAGQQVATLEENADKAGIELFGWQSEQRGIVHVMGPELGVTQPGMTIVCGDSHTSTHGAFGALAFGIGTTEVTHVLATQCLLQRKPRTLAINVNGQLSEGVSAKDLILHIIATIGVDGGTGYVIEYRGSTIETLSMEERMTVCNMTIEAGARAGLIAPDEVTFEWLKGRRYAPSGLLWEQSIQNWRALRTDPGAVFDKEVHIDASLIEPTITWGTHPGTAIGIAASVPRSVDGVDRQSMKYMNVQEGQLLEGTPIDMVFVGSCTNGRLSDLRKVAAVLRGRRVANGVKMLIVPGSESVRRNAESEGLAAVFVEAGAEWRLPGCSMCIAMNGDTASEGQLVVSTSNRNFEGRQGKGVRTILASPVTAAACAVTGVITDPRTLTSLTQTA